MCSSHSNVRPCNVIIRLHVLCAALKVSTHACIALHCDAARSAGNDALARRSSLVAARASQAPIYRALPHAMMQVMMKQKNNTCSYVAGQPRIDNRSHLDRSIEDQSPHCDAAQQAQRYGARTHAHHRTSIRFARTSLLAMQFALVRCI